MALYATLSLLNGCFVTLCRCLNGRLALSAGALRASFWNHLVGFALLLPFALALTELPFSPGASGVPPLAHLAGPLGALFVALNSLVLPRLGATRTVLLVIAGQMIGATYIDYRLERVESLPVQAAGLALILFGAGWSAWTAPSRAAPPDAATEVK